MSLPKSVVLYHRSCHDGFGAALACHLYHVTTGLSEPEYISLDPNRLTDGVKAILHFPPDSVIRAFDIAFNQEAFSLLKNRFSDLIIFDHHKSTVDSFPDGLPHEFHYNNDKCGAILAWDYYFPGENPPLMFQYLLAKDTWKFDLFGIDKINETRQVCLGLYEACQPQYLDREERQPDFSSWANFTLPPNFWWEATLRHGQILEAHQKIVLKQLKKSASLVKFREHTVAICNSSVEISDLGNQLASESQCDYALIWRVSGTTVYISLRSIGEFDVSEIARQFPPGGGHRNAAAFSCQLFQFELKQYQLKINLDNYFVFSM